MTDEALVEALRTLVALERDRLLGYLNGELHTDPHTALPQADDALMAAGEDTGDLILPADREELGLQPMTGAVDQ